MGDMVQQSAVQGQKTLPPAQMRTLNNAMSMSMRIGVAVGILYMVMVEAVQVTCYGLGIWYLRRPHIRALYANQEGAALVEPVSPTPGEPLA
jgi:hypothetical protein